jgi:hypothetical protein
MSRFREDVKAVMDALALPIPGVTAGTAFGYPAYKAGGKVVAFVGGEGIGLKLGAERAAALIAERDDIHPFEPVAGTVWKAWVSIDHADADAFRDDEALIIEAVEFVTRG